MREPWDWREFRRDTTPRTYIHPLTGQVLPSITAIIGAHTRKHAVQASARRRNALQPGLADAAARVAAARGNALDDAAKAYAQGDRDACPPVQYMAFWPGLRAKLDELALVGRLVWCDAYVFDEEAGGTLDLLYEVAGRLLLVDVKSHTSRLEHENDGYLQLGAYASRIESMTGRHVDHAMLLCAYPDYAEKRGMPGAHVVRRWKKFMDAVRMAEFVRKVEGR